MSLNEMTYDLLVIGGGINGAGIARDAAGRGLKVLLVEKDDLAQHTSSASTKLIHGGLRYLETYDFALVSKALAEREVLLRAAPHIIWPMRFVLPHQKGQRPAWLIRLGLFLYDHLGGRKILPGTKVLRRQTSTKFEPLKTDYKFAFEYSDCWVDDARLVVLNAVSACEHGADVKTRTEVTGLKRLENHWIADLKKADGQVEKASAKVVVNAAGPWVDDLCNIAFNRSDNQSNVRLVKGSHIITDRRFDGDHSYFFQNGDGRIMFAIPYQEGRFTLIGTTDELYEANRNEVKISEKEIDYLISSANEYFENPIRHEDIVSTYSGVRPLYDDKTDNVSKVTRDYVLSYDANNGASIVSVYGGKITTYRTLAEAVMKLLEQDFADLKPDWTRTVSLLGGDMPDSDFEAFFNNMKKRYSWCDTDVLRRLCRYYGTRIDLILDGATSLTDLGQTYGCGLSDKELEYLVHNEFVTCAEDILQRRTKLSLHLDARDQQCVQNWFDQENVPISA